MEWDHSMRCPDAEEPFTADIDQKQTFRVDVLEFINEAGAKVFYERYEGEFPLSFIEQDKKFKMACEVCEKFGKNLSCPPFSPTFGDYVKDDEKAKVICLRIPQEYFDHVIPEEKYNLCFEKGRQLLTEELVQFKKQGFRIAGSGPCLACKKCSAETDVRICFKPEERIFSLESLGVNLILLANQCFNIDLEWTGYGRPADFVCAIGAVFFRENLK
jgi:predicted metal-binding protein